MKRVAFISCVSQKMKHKAPAKELYISSLFKKNLAWALREKFDAIYILSAKYGLVELNQIIEPYEKTLNKMPINKRREWAKQVLDSLQKVEDLKNTEFTFLAGKRYREFLEADLPNYKVPMEGLPIGKQLKWLTDKIQEG